MAEEKKEEEAKEEQGKKEATEEQEKKEETVDQEKKDEQPQEAAADDSGPRKPNLVYAALLLHSAGQQVTEDGVKKVAAATGVSVEDVQVKALVAALEGIDIDEAVSSAAITPATSAAPATEASDEKKEEEDEEDREKKAEEAASGLGQLFQ